MCPVWGPAARPSEKGSRAAGWLEAGAAGGGRLHPGLFGLHPVRAAGAKPSRASHHGGPLRLAATAEMPTAVVVGGQSLGSSRVPSQALPWGRLPSPPPARQRRPQRGRRQVAARAGRTRCIPNSEVSGLSHNRVMDRTAAPEQHMFVHMFREAWNRICLFHVLSSDPRPATQLRRHGGGRQP